MDIGGSMTRRFIEGDADPAASLAFMAEGIGPPAKLSTSLLGTGREGV